MRDFVSFLSEKLGEILDGGNKNHSAGEDPGARKRIISEEQRARLEEAHDHLEEIREKIVPEEFPWTWILATFSVALDESKQVDVDAMTPAPRLSRPFKYLRTISIKISPHSGDSSASTSPSGERATRRVVPLEENTETNRESFLHTPREILCGVNKYVI